MFADDAALFFNLRVHLKTAGSYLIEEPWLKRMIHFLNIVKKFTKILNCKSPALVAPGHTALQRRLCVRHPQIVQELLLMVCVICCRSENPRCRDALRPSLILFLLSFIPDSAFVITRWTAEQNHIIETCKEEWRAVSTLENASRRKLDDGTFDTFISSLDR
jgi:hypothetical protein